MAEPSLDRSDPGRVVAASESAAQSKTPAVLRAIDAWMKSWRRGKLELTGEGARRALGKKSIAIRMDALSSGGAGRLTARREIELLVAAAAKLNNAEAAERILNVASAGLDRERYKPSSGPHVVRGIGEAGLAKLASTEAKDYLLRAARAEVADSSRNAGLQPAALRALGTLGEGAFRPTLEEQLRSSSEAARLAAAQALGQLGAAASAEPLANMVSHEKINTILEAAVLSLQKVLVAHHKTVATPVLRLAVKAAIGALGRGGWRADLAIVNFLEKVRHQESIPALIDVLQRFVDHPEQVRTGQLSGLLRHRALETLMSLTGAYFPIDKPDRWRTFWEEEKASFVLAKAPEPEPKQAEDDSDEQLGALPEDERFGGRRRRRAPAKPKKRPVGTVSTGFFGIPVQGTRVVFIVDLSGSMNFPMGGPTRAGGGDGDTKGAISRLDRAKAELERAVTELSSDASFNLVSFNGNPKAKVWSSKLVQATDTNKKRFLKFVRGMRADGGTNTWAGMEQALKIKSLIYGDRYDTHVDEVFVLTDGIPTVGNVIDTREILELVAETNRFAKVRINTVYIADRLTAGDRRSIQMSGMSGKRFLDLMAEQNSGTAVSL